MSKKHGKNHRRGIGKSSSRQKAFVLETSTLDDIVKAKQETALQKEFAWKMYSELALQRNEIELEIRKSLIATSIPLEIKNWQRAVKYKYSLHPLSTRGSLSFVGGRFNTGKDVNSVQTFPALYLAEDKDTALQEHLAQNPTKKNAKLTSRELALTHPSSETIVSVSGKFDKIFDLTNPANLAPFVELIKDFSLSKEVVSLGNKLNYSTIPMITTPKMLQEQLLMGDWRSYPVLYDIPANSQVFGQLLYLAEIEGILYRSKFTKKLCVAIFPRNFVETESFVSLDDTAPHPKVPTRIDAKNWRISEMSADEIISESA